MLDAFIIDQIRKRERVEKEDRRPQLELPLPAEPRPEYSPEHSNIDSGSGSDDGQRGVIIIDFGV